MVKESGTNNKSGDAGGSFGIGKSAYFACSNMHTVFISSLSEEYEKSTIGVSRLISFECGNDENTQGTGYYGQSEKLLAFEELADFDGAPIRTEPGTDIYILDYAVEDKINVNANLEYYVIANFLISLLTKQLIVYIGDLMIDSSYVDTYFEKYKKEQRESLSQEIKELLDYYTIYKNEDNQTLIINLNSKEFGAEYGFKDGECTLYLRKGTDLNRRVLVSRKTGMKIYLQKNISSNIQFSGILYVSGHNMNKFFREMETPAHNEWRASEQSDNYEIQKKAYNELKKYIRDTVSFHFEDKIGDEFDAFDAGRFLPKDLLNNGSENVNEKNNSMVLNEEVKLSIRTMKPSKKQINTADIFNDKEFLKDIEEDNMEGGEKTGSGEDEGIGTKYGPETKQETGIGRGSGKEEGDGVSTGHGNENTQNNGDIIKKSNDSKCKNYKNIEISRRVICMNPKMGLYNVIINVPGKAKSAKLEFSLAGEQSDIKLNICNAQIMRGGAQVVKVSKNVIFLENLSKGEKIKVAVVVSFKDYCMMEVGYYESKK